MLYFMAGGGKRFFCNIKVTLEKIMKRLKLASFHMKESCSFSEKVSYQKEKTKERNWSGIWGGGKEEKEQKGRRERESFRFCWIQKAQRRRWCPNRKSIIRSFASCYTQCRMFTEEKMKKCILRLIERWRSEAEPFFHCPSVTSIDATDRWGQEIGESCERSSVFRYSFPTFPKKALCCSMAILQQF